MLELEWKTMMELKIVDEYIDDIYPSGTYKLNLLCIYDLFHFQ